MRRKDREQSKGFALKVCDECSFAVISMVSDDHKPYSVAVNIVRDNDVIYFHSAKQGYKNNILAGNPDVCINCVSSAKVIEDKFTTEFCSAVITGTASIVTDEKERYSALKQLCERHTPTAMDMFDEQVAKSLNVTELWRIDIIEITGKKLET